MRGRLWLAGLLAGLAAFAWGAVSHMALGLGNVGLQPLPNEAVVLGTMSQNVKGPGLYLFPAMGEKDQTKMNEAFATQPRGLLVVTPPSGQPIPWGPLLGLQALIDVVGGLIAAFVLATAAPRLRSYLARAWFVAILGAFAAITIVGPYWIWYGFPMSFLLASLVDNLLAWGVAGLVLAGMIRPD